MKRFLAALIFLTIASVLFAQSMMIQNGVPTGGGGTPDVTSGLVGRWKFDDGSGATAVDATGGTNGSLQNTPAWVAGQIGSGALQLTAASSQYVLLPSPTTALQTTPAVTVTAWINCASFPNAYNTIFARTPAIGSYYGLFVTSAGKLAVYVYGSGPSSIDPATTTLSTGVWYFVGFTYDSTNGPIAYVNGSSDGTGAANGDLTMGGADGPASIGEDLVTTGRFLNCTVDDPRVYNRALSSSEMTTVYNFRE